MTPGQLARIEKREEIARERIEAAVGAVEAVLETCRAARLTVADNPIPGDRNANVGATMEADILVASVEHVSNLLQAAAFMLIAVTEDARKLAKRYR